MFRRIFMSLVFVAGCGNSDGNGPDGGVDAMPDAAVSKDLRAFPLVGVQGGIAYTIQVTLGGTQTFDLDIDTGSTTLGVAATTCGTCGVTPLYAPGATAMDQGATSMSTYGDGSGWTAENYLDNVKLTGADTDVKMRFGAIKQQNGFFRGGFDQGIIGFAAALIALPGTDSFVSKRIAAGDNGQFAFQFCPNDGTLWMNGYDPAKTVSAPEFSPMVPLSAGQPFYEVNITSSTIGTTAVGVSGPAVVDTGTSVLVVSTAAETSMINAISASAGYKSLFPGQTLSENTCLTAGGKTHAQIDAALPPFTMTLPAKGGGAPFTLSLPATQSYLIDIPGMGLCFGVAGANGLPTIMGDTIMRGFVTVFDVATKQIGFAPQQGCVLPAKPTQQGPLTLTPPHWIIQGH